MELLCYKLIRGANFCIQQYSDRSTVYIIIQKKINEDFSLAQSHFLTFSIIRVALECVRSVVYRSC